MSSSLFPPSTHLQTCATPQEACIQPESKRAQKKCFWTFSERPKCPENLQNLDASFSNSVIPNTSCWERGSSICFLIHFLRQMFPNPSFSTTSPVGLQEEGSGRCFYPSVRFNLSFWLLFWATVGQHLYHTTPGLATEPHACYRRPIPSPQAGRRCPAPRWRAGCVDLPLQLPDGLPPAH